MIWHVCVRCEVAWQGHTRCWSCGCQCPQYWHMAPSVKPSRVGELIALVVRSERRAA